MNRFKELKVWQKSMDLTTEIYRVTEGFPSKEKFGLISQINRSVVSIPSNIAEGAGRDSNKQFSQFLNIAIGSSFELETQLIIAQNLQYIGRELSESFLNNISDIQNMLYGLKRSLK